MAPTDDFFLVLQECGFGKHTYEPLTDCVFPLDCGASTFRESSNLQARLLDISERAYYWSASLILT